MRNKIHCLYLLFTKYSYIILLWLMCYLASVIFLNWLWVVLSSWDFLFWLYSYSCKLLITQISSMSGYDLNLICVWWKFCLVVFNGSLMKRVHLESSRIICYILNDMDGEQLILWTNVFMIYHHLFKVFKYNIWVPNNHLFWYDRF